MRGKILYLTREEAVTRALSQVAVLPVPPPGSPLDAGNRPIAYRLEGGYNGGDDPTAPHCASWSYGYRTPTADCIGLVLWASGIDRKQPSFNGSRGEWLNCASLLDDADGAQVFCRPLSKSELPTSGDWVLTRGHIGMLIRPPRVVGHSGMWEIAPALVVDCSPRHGRQAAVGVGRVWSGNCRFIRPRIYMESK